MEEHNEKYWQSLYELYKESSKQFDRNVLYIASGSLALSLNFINDIIDLEKIVCKPLLILSWTTFVAVIVISLISHYLSMKAINQKMKTVENDDDPLSNLINRIVSFLNIMMVILLPIAILLLIIFTYLNI